MSVDKRPPPKKRILPIKKNGSERTLTAQREKSLLAEVSIKRLTQIAATDVLAGPVISKFIVIACM
jgi:hypothetical protein